MAMATTQEHKQVGIGEVEEEEKWVTHYSSSHQILLVGEGDFSFSLCLALCFGSASNICASSRDSKDIVIKKYKKAKSNLGTLEKLGASILHDVDAKEMKYHPNLRMRKFDRIIFNFPHAGFYGKEDNKLLIEMHRDVVHGFFRNASGMLRTNGEIHVSHKIKPPFSSWNLVELASKNSLFLSEVVPFKIEDYPGYNNKRGDGLRCDEPFHLGECSTFKFRFCSASKKSKMIGYKGFTNRMPRHLQERSIQMQKLEPSFDLGHPHTFDLGHPHTNISIDINELPGYARLPSRMNIQRESPMILNDFFNNIREPFPRTGNDVDYFVRESLRFDSFAHPQTNFNRSMDDLPGYVGLPLTSDIRRESVRSSDGCLYYFRETLGRPVHGMEYSVHGSPILDFERYKAEAPGRTLNGYCYFMDELHRLSNLRSAQLQRMRLHYSNPQ